MDLSKMTSEELLKEFGDAMAIYWSVLQSSEQKTKSRETGDILAREILRRLRERDRLREALKFYANSEHMGGDWSEWENPSGEAESILCPPNDLPMHVEDGGVARQALNPENGKE